MSYLNYWETLEYEGLVPARGRSQRMPGSQPGTESTFAYKCGHQRAIGKQRPILESHLKMVIGGRKA